jgi:hypothetical protein
MSDYFGALMKSSGLASASESSPRLPPTSVAMPDAPADIVELDIMRATDSHVSRAQQRDGPSPAGGAAPPVVTAPAEATPSSTARGPSAPRQSGRQSPGSARAAAGIGAAVEIVSDTIVNSPAAATPDAPQSNMLRAALEWVAADPRGIDATPGLETRERVANRSSAADASVDSEPMEIEATRTLGPSADMALAQLVRNATPPTSSASSALPASIPEEVVEISIGAIHVRVDAPTPSTTARIAPNEGTQTRSSTARSTMHSALSRRALRRI